MDDLITVWNEFVNGLEDKSILKPSGFLSKDQIPSDLCNLIFINNGQDIEEKGIFKLIKSSFISHNTTWTRYRFINSELINSICGRIRTEIPESKYLDEIPFAIIGDLKEIGECLTINKLTLEISKVTFGIKPKNYDLREVLNHVQYKNKIANNMIDFIKTQIMFNEM